MCAKRVRTRRWLWLAAFTMPLAALGPCYVSAEQALVNGFFNAVNPLLRQQLENLLGLSGQTTTGGTTGSTTTGGTQTTT